MTILSRCSALFDINVLPYRVQLFELCDLAIIPSILKHRCQETLTAQWTHKLPIIQTAAPAQLAAALIQQVLNNIQDINTTPYTIVDFCSGAGGPTPFIEKSVNAQRKRLNQRPILFRLSDLEPNLDAWIDAASKSEYLSFVPQAVDATRPPASVRSVSSVSTHGNVSGQTKMVHLFCLCFHHFDDEMARRVLRSVMRDSDAFVVVELQDRSLGCVLLLSLEWLLLFVVTLFWFWHDLAHLLLTYWVPVLPFVHTWDGIVSCLRTRTREEMEGLVAQIVSESQRESNGEGHGRAIDDWTISSIRKRHTWPFGYMNAFIGIRNDCRRDS